MPGLIRPVLRAFALCLAQDEQQAVRFRALGARNTASVGDLKSAAASLAADPAELAALRSRIGDRPVWIAASTHPGEEEIAAAIPAAQVAALTLWPAATWPRVEGPRNRVPYRPTAQHAGPRVRSSHLASPPPPC